MDETHIELLRGGPAGVAEWNSLYRAAEITEPDLDGAVLAGLDLSEAILSNASLRGANLVGADLSRVALRHANLEDADLSETCLWFAEFHSARLSNATLKDATLNRVGFASADLNKADFERAHMRSVRFSNANLNGTSFLKATFGFNEFYDVDLSQAIGLDQIEHYGPSVVGWDTILKSGGDIPNEFLTGAGVGEVEIQSIPHMVKLTEKIPGREIGFHSIAYAKCDETFARQLHDRLQECGIRCWLWELGRQFLIRDTVDIDPVPPLPPIICMSEESQLPMWNLLDVLAMDYSGQPTVVLDMERTIAETPSIERQNRIFLDFPRSAMADSFQIHVDRLVEVLKSLWRASSRQA